MLLNIDKRDGLYKMGINRVEKRNAFNAQLLAEFATAYDEFNRDSAFRCAVVYALGPHFSAGLDLADVAPRLTSGEHFIPSGLPHPWGFAERRSNKPVVVAVQGRCLTIGLELILGADICIANEDATFAQLEISRGLFPFAGATIRLPQVAGWGNAMRWLLTGDEFDAHEAHRIGVVQEVVTGGRHLERALELAGRIAAQAPLGVQATIRSARTAIEEGVTKAVPELFPEMRRLFQSNDAQIGVASFLSRERPEFSGT